MLFRASVAMLAFTTPGVMLLAQAQAQPAPTNAAAPVVRTTPSYATLRPSVEILKRALPSLNIEKWKASSAVKNEAQSNLDSVQRDVDSTLPPLVAAADAAPGLVSKAIPVFRNVDALYDVLLRLDAAGRLAAPKDQMSALDQALASVSDARRTLGEQLQTNAAAQETQITRLQAQLKAVPPPPAAQPAPVECTPPPTKKRRSRTTKSSSKTSTQHTSATSH